MRHESRNDALGEADLMRSVGAACLSRREVLLLPIAFMALLSACSDQPREVVIGNANLPMDGFTQTPAPSTDSDGAGEFMRPTDPEPVKPPIGITVNEDYRPSLDHGDKSAAYQKYIVLHDTEGDSDPASVISWWDGNGNLVAAHFVVGKDGTIYQCVPLDRIAHHAGYGDVGHNDLYGTAEDGRDDMRGSVWIGDGFPDYGMNAYSIGIELVHIGGSGFYPEEQLEALDALIASIDGSFGFESRIIDHKAWRSGNSDTSPEFAGYLANYQDHRTHGGNQ
jgi:hypothetical protein